MNKSRKRLPAVDSHGRRRYRKVLRGGQEVTDWTEFGGVGEIQEAINKWADEAFGPAPDPVRIATRANQEMAELLRELTVENADSNMVAYEAVDVVIVMYRLAETMGFDLDFVLRKKMEINERRKWVREGKGVGYRHVSCAHPWHSNPGLIMPCPECGEER